MTNRVFFLIGQTASGKGAVAAELAPRIGAEIISLDSMKIYRTLDIGTAKPSPERRAKIRYHMIDVADPSEHFSTALYLEGAERAAADIHSRGKCALFSGGTALYLKALTEGIFEGPAADPEFRAKIRAEAAETSTAELHARLAKIDPAAAAKIHPNDLRRIERALEVYEKTGKPISELQTQFGTPGGVFGSAPVMGIRRTKEDLHERINRRVDMMVSAGLADEVRRVYDTLGKEASQAVGYKEFGGWLRGEMTLDEAIEAVKLRTRQFAKAQMTWFKSMKNIEWFDVAPEESPATTAGRIENYLYSLPPRKML